MTYIKVNLKNYYYLKYKERILIINCQNYEFINITLNKSNSVSLYNYVKILILNNPIEMCFMVQYWYIFYINLKEYLSSKFWL